MRLEDCGMNEDGQAASMRSSGPSVGTAAAEGAGSDESVFSCVRK